MFTVKQAVLDAIGQALLAGDHRYHVWARENPTGGRVFDFENANAAITAIHGAIGYENVESITAEPILARYTPTKHIYSK